MAEAPKVVQFPGAFRGRQPVQDAPMEEAVPAQGGVGSAETGTKTPSADEFVDLLRSLMDGGISGQNVAGLNRGLVERSAQSYSGLVDGYSDDEIKAFLRQADEFRQTKPAFYMALKDAARAKGISII